jgi:hypothetical protein
LKNLKPNPTHSFFSNLYAFITIHASDNIPTSLLIPVLNSAAATKLYGFSAVTALACTILGYSKLNILTAISASPSCVVALAPCETKASQITE